MATVTDMNELREQHIDIGNGLERPRHSDLCTTTLPNEIVQSQDNTVEKS